MRIWPVSATAKCGWASITIRAAWQQRSVATPSGGCSSARAARGSATRLTRSVTQAIVERPSTVPPSKSPIIWAKPVQLPDQLYSRRK
eukprot:scaffold101770_cov77-Phaeocystis_antarctica.AAC.2